MQIFALLLHTYLPMTNNHCPFSVYKCDCINNRCLFFCRLKINHDTPKFIPDSGTVANNNPTSIFSHKKGMKILSATYGTIIW